MTDIVTVTAEVNFEALSVPKAVKASVSSDGETVTVGLDELEPHVIDVLAWQWLEHLYAGLNMSNPFSKEFDTP